MSAAVDKFLERLERVSGAGPGQWRARCPAHPDKNPSLSVGEGDDGRVLFECKAGCEHDDVMQELGFTDADLFDKPRPTSDVYYTYTDETGEPLYQVCRTPSRQFSQRRADGHGGWTSGAGCMNGVRRVPYRLPELVAAHDAGKVVLILEGEKDVDAAYAHGHVATCNSGGAGKWRQEFAEHLRGLSVVIVADRDKAGRAHARSVAATLEGVASEVEIRQSRTGSDHSKDDLSDHFAAGFDVDQLEPVIAQASPSPGALDGAALLDDVVEFVSSFVAFPQPEQAQAVALWIAHTHAFAAAVTTPRLSIQSAEKQSGKTRCQEVMELMVRAPLRIASISPAALFRRIDKSPPTLLWDEIDALFSARSTGPTEELRALLNAGYQEGAVVPRCVGEKHDTHDFKVFAPVCLAGIGVLPDTVQDRSILIRMRRRRPDEHVARFRRRLVAPDGYVLRDRLAEWTAAKIDKLTVAIPDIPAELSDRQCDAWEPLFAIADEAGGEWAERARAAALVLSEANVDESKGVQLLEDLRTIFGDKFHMSSHDLCRALRAVDTSPWGEWVDPRWLAKRLRPFDVRPTKIRQDETTTAQGYLREHLDDAWNRYLPHITEQPEHSTAVTSTVPDVPAVPQVWGIDGTEESNE